MSNLVNSLKEVSARRLREKHCKWLNQNSMNGRLWSPSNFAASCGGAPLSIIKQYIENQNHPYDASWRKPLRRSRRE